MARQAVECPPHATRRQVARRSRDLIQILTEECSILPAELPLYRGPGPSDDKHDADGLLRGELTLVRVRVKLISSAWRPCSESQTSAAWLSLYAPREQDKGQPTSAQYGIRPSPGRQYQPVRSTRGQAIAAHCDLAGFRCVVGGSSSRFSGKPRIRHACHRWRSSHTTRTLPSK